jgi:hypothetical protein
VRGSCGDGTVTFMAMLSFAARRCVWNRRGSAIAFGDHCILVPLWGKQPLSVKLFRILRYENVCFGKADQCHNRELILTNLFWSPHINQVSYFNASSSRAVISLGSSVVTFRPNIKTNRDIYSVYIFVQIQTLGLFGLLRHR